MRAIRWISVLLSMLVVTMVAVGVAEQGDGSSRSPRPAVSSAYSHDALQPDANMTQQMSTPNANTDSQFHRADGQLDRSKSSSAYVRALEQHQRDMDRMLARPTP